MCWSIYVIGYFRVYMDFSFAFQILVGKLTQSKKSDIVSE